MLRPAARALHPPTTPPPIASPTSPASFGIPLALPGLLILSVDLLTEQGPAISLAYEPAESALMRVPPRDLVRDRLVDSRLLRYAYLLAGLATTGACLLAYFLVMLIGGVSGSDLWQASARGYFQSADSPPFRTAEFEMTYGHGICRAGEAVDMGVAAGVSTISASWQA